MFNLIISGYNLNVFLKLLCLNFFNKKEWFFNVIGILGFSDRLIGREFF